MAEPGRTAAGRPATTDEGLVVEHLSHAYGARRVLKDISFRVAPGEILCLLGPSGCGKTTTLRLIAGLEDLQNGRIVWNGDVLCDEAGSVAPEHRQVSLLFQDFALFPHLTVAENVGFGLTDLSASARQARVTEVLDQVGMLGYARSYPHVLSGGEQQRIALARARAPRPRVFLLDEPFSNLDTRRRNQLRDLSLHILKRSESSTVIVTHDAEEAMFMGDRIAVMRDGRILQEGTPHELYFHPSSGFVAALFGEVNEVTGRIREGHVDTPFGRFCAPDLAENTAVDVFIRPEALTLGQPGAAGHDAPATGQVMAARLLGRSGLVHLSVPVSGGTDLHFHARTRPQGIPAEGSTVTIAVDESQVFVFPSEPAAD